MSSISTLLLTTSEVMVFTFSISSCMLFVVSMTKQTAWLDPLEIPTILTQGESWIKQRRTPPYTPQVKHAAWVSYSKNFMSPTAPRMSCSSSMVAAMASCAASVWMYPWLEPKKSLLIPPLGFSIPVVPGISPWRHLPLQQTGERKIVHFNDTRPF